MAEGGVDDAGVASDGCGCGCRYESVRVLLAMSGSLLYRGSGNGVGP